MRPRQLDGRRVDDEYQNTCLSSKLRPYEFTRGFFSARVGCDDWLAEQICPTSSRAMDSTFTRYLSKLPSMPCRRATSDRGRRTLAVGCGHAAVPSVDARIGSLAFNAQ